MSASHKLGPHATEAVSPGPMSPPPFLDCIEAVADLRARERSNGLRRGIQWAQEGLWGAIGEPSRAEWGLILLRLQTALTTWVVLAERA
jgi:hypothetical protein